MKTERNILIAFLLNLFFSVFEFIGGVVTGSVAILSDAVHDMGDAAAIGVSYLLEKKSKHEPDEKYTYGYARFSVVGSAISTLILIVGSVMIIYNSALRLISPTPINYNGMIIFAVIGVCVNFLSAIFTREGDSLNQKSVNLHMLEDLLGWVIVLIGAVVMRFTDFALLDPLMSVGVALFIFINAIKNLKMLFEIFLEKTPQGIDLNEIINSLLQIEGVLGVHHVHIRSFDGYKNYATMHIITNGDAHEIKEMVRAELRVHGICHATLELEAEGEPCHEEHCDTEIAPCPHHHHHH
ncbi:MAG: cation transporter [Clostridia bacterium]|nr:cation transporter [Clostridia bacterium]